MYGLLLENLATFIKIQWGEGKWESVRRHAGVDSPTFSVHHVYAETLIPRLARSAVQVLGVGEHEFFESMGVYFVEFMGQYGYDQVMSVLGRHMRDFLNGLDNLHEYLKFSYPRMRAPSFYCDNETMDGLRLHYRSKRRGFVHYAMGQIKQVAKHFYDTKVGIELLSEELDGEMMHVIFQLKFDNRAFGQAQSLVKLIHEEEQLPVKASMLFDLFPFCIVFCQEMVIRHTGHSLINILTDLVGQSVTEAFDLVRPLIPFAFHNILERTNNVFELVTVAPIQDNEFDDEEETGVSLRLKGQMLYMDDWRMIMFLCTPQMPDLEHLLASGLYINDLSLHDCSRDLVLAGTQQSVELKLALDQEQQKSKKLEDSMKQLDAEMKRTDELLYQMIPKQVADRIRRGENPVDTCEVFDSVSVLFSDVVTFTEICSRINPMQVVSMLNHMYSLFDQLTERNGVYKVETVGDAYMVVGGAPIKDPNHAERICDMALDMIDASKAIKDPSGETDHLTLRVGVHSGMVVAGVVGLKMPRYCLFGDTVNTSSRMETSSEPGKIQISETTKALLSKIYDYEFRGEVPVKGKGQMSTFWLKGRKERVSLSELQCNSFSWSAPATIAGPPDVLDQFRTPFGSLDEMGKSMSIESVVAPLQPSRGFGRAATLVREPTIEERGDSGRPSSKPKSITAQESIIKTESHIPQMMQQPLLSSMNLEAARKAVTEQLLENQEVREVSESSTKAPEPKFPKAVEPVKAKGEVNSKPKNKVEFQEPQPLPKPVILEKDKPENTQGIPSSNVSTSGNPSKPIVKESVAAQNQKQEDLLNSKATLDNSVPNSNSVRKSNPDESSDNPRSNNNSENEDGSNPQRKNPLLKRMRENKVALLTSDAMAKMGCTGLTPKQKQVVSQACQLL